MFKEATPIIFVLTTLATDVHPISEKYLNNMQEEKDAPPVSKN